METVATITDIREAVSVIKTAIQRTRYMVMRHANKEALTLYYSVGGYLTCQAAKAKWGDKVLDTISAQLQQEMPGLRGFSMPSLKRMRLFYETWASVFSSLPMSQSIVKISSLTTSQFDNDTLNAFLTVQFTHHSIIINKTNTLEERLFYIRKVAAEFWSVEKLRYNLDAHLYQKEGVMPNNFSQALPDEKQRQKAAEAFRKNYKLEFMHIDDPDDWDEKRVESEIVRNIRTFIMALGSDFSFMGNQYRVIVDEREYFIDLLFFNRRLRSMVAIELKWTEFKPEYAGKMNFYLSALDDTLRLPDENPSIGIILCRGQKQKTVEYALRDTNKPMGVATYRAANELPSEYGSALKGLEGLKELL